MTTANALRGTAPPNWRPGAIETRRAVAAVAARSFDPQTRECEAIIATPHEVARWFGRERLRIASDAIDFTRIRSGRAPLLAHHDERSPIGAVLDAWIDGDALVARLRFNDTPRGREYAGMAERGELLSISVGYAVQRLVRVEIGDDDEETFEAVAWQPMEVSVVSVAADPNTHIRSLPLKGHAMEPELITTPAPAPAPDLTRAERARITTLHDIAQRAEIDRSTLDSAIERGTSVEEFRRAAFDQMTTRVNQSRIDPSQPSGNGQTFDNPAFLGRAIEDSLVARMTGGAPENPAARELMGRSLLQLGETFLASRGVRVSWSSRDGIVDAIFARSAGGGEPSWVQRGSAGGLHTTSDFPVLLQGAGQRVLQAAYEAAETPLKALARRRSANDFRPLTRIQLGEMPRLEKVNEKGEIKRGSRAESAESFRVETFAKIFGVTRQAIINDDLNAFGDASRAWGMASANKESDVIVDLFLANAGDGVVGSDTETFFSAAHGNKASTATALSLAALGAARQAMRVQKGLDGTTPLNIRPRHLVVSPELETTAEQVVMDLAAAKWDDTNPFAKLLIVHVEPRFTGLAWRLFADPAQLAALEIAYLNGAAGPQVSTMEGWDTLGVEFRCVLDFGAGPGDWRAAYLNAGALPA